MKIHALVLAFALCFTAHADAASLKRAQQVKASTIITRMLPVYYGKFGVVTALGAPLLSRTKRHRIVKATGEFNGNQPWVGAANYRYAVNVNLETGLITQRHKPVETRETN